MSFDQVTDILSIVTRACANDRWAIHELLVYLLDSFTENPWSQSTYLSQLMPLWAQRERERDRQTNRQTQTDGQTDRSYKQVQSSDSSRHVSKYHYYVQAIKDSDDRGRVNWGKRDDTVTMET